MKTVLKQRLAENRRSLLCPSVPIGSDLLYFIAIVEVHFGEMFYRGVVLRDWDADC